MSYLREQEQLRAKFLTAVAHELEMPVTVIKGYGQLLWRWGPAKPDERVRKALGMIEAQCERIHGRVQELLEVVRFRMAPLELRRERFDLDTLVTQVLRRLQPANPRQRLVLEHARPAPVWADRARMEEVLARLLDNAAMLSAREGDISVRVWSEACAAVVAIHNEGNCIPWEHQSHLFDPFSDTTSADYPGCHGGVTLSLYLNKLQLERHQGRIWCESAEHHGATFFVSLPLATENDGAVAVA